MSMISKRLPDVFIKKKKSKKIENSVKEKEKSECGRCVRADFFALLWGLMGSWGDDMNFSGHCVHCLTLN